MNFLCFLPLVFGSLILQSVAGDPAIAPVPKGPVQQIEISATYKDFPKPFELDKKIAGEVPQGVLATTRVTTNAGNRAVIELIREVRYPINETQFETTNAGVTLEVSPSVKDGKIVLSGTAIVVQHLQPGVKQALNAVTFARRETHFTGTVPNAAPFTIDVGDGKEDKAKVILSARLLTPGEIAVPMKLAK